MMELASPINLQRACRPCTPAVGLSVCRPTQAQRKPAIAPSALTRPPLLHLSTRSNPPHAGQRGAVCGRAAGLLPWPRRAGQHSVPRPTHPPAAPHGGPQPRAHAGRDAEAWRCVGVVVAWVVVLPRSVGGGGERKALAARLFGGPSACALWPLPRLPALGGWQQDWSWASAATSSCPMPALAAWPRLFNTPHQFLGHALLRSTPLMPRAPPAPCPRSQRACCWRRTLRTQLPSCATPLRRTGAAPLAWRPRAWRPAPSPAPQAPAQAHAQADALRGRFSQQQGNRLARLCLPPSKAVPREKGSWGAAVACGRSRGRRPARQRSFGAHCRKLVTMPRPVLPVTATTMLGVVVPPAAVPAPARG